MFKLLFCFRGHAITPVYCFISSCSSPMCSVASNLQHCSDKSNRTAPQSVISVLKSCHLSLQKKKKKKKSHIYVSWVFVRLARTPLPTCRSFNSFHLRWQSGWPDGHLMLSQSHTWLGCRSVTVLRAARSTKSFFPLCCQTQCGFRDCGRPLMSCRRRIERGHFWNTLANKCVREHVPSGK